MPLQNRLTTIVSRLMVTFGLLIVGACESPPSVPSPPAPPPPSTPPPTFTVSGIVAEAGTAIADASVNVFAQTKTWGGGGSGRTDAQGRYQIGGIPIDSRVWPSVFKPGYVQQCAATPFVIQSDATVDLELVSRTNLSASSRPSAPGFRTVTGVVLKMTATGLQPMTDMYVGFHVEEIDPSGDAASAFTLTDSRGRFALCGLPESEPVTIGAGDTSGYKFIKVPPGQVSGVEIVLP